MHQDPVLDRQAIMGALAVAEVLVMVTGAITEVRALRRVVIRLITSSLLLVQGESIFLTGLEILLVGLSIWLFVLILDISIISNRRSSRHISNRRRNIRSRQVTNEQDLVTYRTGSSRRSKPPQTLPYRHRSTIRTGKPRNLLNS